METYITKPKLLLADDSVTIRKVVEMTFAEENVEVFTVSDGESAMLKFVEAQPDIVLAHVGLPGTNGYQICEMIKQDETTQHIPVLLLVGSFEPFDGAEAERVRADGFLRKPFPSVRELVARVKDLLGHASSPVAIEPETEDIEDLYQSSFVQTDEIDEFTTVEDALDYQQFDDEMIETSTPAVSNDESSGGHGPAVVTTEHSREFDWSPEAVITQSDVVIPQETSVENASIAAEHGVSQENGDGGSATAVGFAPESPQQETSEPQSSEIEIAEPTSDFIALVAQRVVEKLSDKVIREVAQDVVPGIAEKLMREALGQDKKG